MPKPCKRESCGFETSRDLAVSRSPAWWIVAQEYESINHPLFAETDGSIHIQQNERDSAHMQHHNTAHSRRPRVISQCLVFTMLKRIVSHAQTFPKLCMPSTPLVCWKWSYAEYFTQTEPRVSGNDHRSRSPLWQYQWRSCLFERYADGIQTWGKRLSSTPENRSWARIADEHRISNCTETYFYIVTKVIVLGFR